MLSAIHHAALDFAVRSPKIANHRHIRSLSSNFFRPTFQRDEIVIQISTASANKGWAHLHFETKQRDKQCIAGYIMLTDFAAPGIDVNTNWKLLPPPRPVDFRSLEADNDDEWISLQTPFKDNDKRMAGSFIKYYIPRHRPDEHRHISDCWITPGWEDPSLPNGAVFTMEMLHFVLDSGFPIYPGLVTGDALLWHQQVVASGLLQRRLRNEGKDHKVVGEGLTQEDLSRLPIPSTLVLHTEVKRPLTEQGTKWAFLRMEHKRVVGGRLDYDMSLMSMEGELLATCQHVSQLIPASKKNVEKASPKTNL